MPKRCNYGVLVQVLIRWRPWSATGELLYFLIFENVLMDIRLAE